MKQSFISFTSVCFFFHQVAQNSRSVLKVTKKRLRKMCSILLGIKKVDNLNNQKNPFKIRVYFFFYQAWWNVCEIRHVVTVNWWWHNGTFVLWRNNWTTEKQPNKHSLFPVLSHRRSDPAVFLTHFSLCCSPQRSPLHKSELAWFMLQCVRGPLDWLATAEQLQTPTLKRCCSAHSQFPRLTLLAQSFSVCQGEERIN